MESNIGEFGLVEKHNPSELADSVSTGTYLFLETSPCDYVSFGLSALQSAEKAIQPDVVFHQQSQDRLYLFPNDLTLASYWGSKEGDCTFCSEHTTIYLSVYDIRVYTVSDPDLETLYGKELLSTEYVTPIYVLDAGSQVGVCEACAESIDEIRDTLFDKHSQTVLSWEV